jgi:hypothetical protein
VERLTTVHIYTSKPLYRSTMLRLGLPSSGHKKTTKCKEEKGNGNRTTKKNNQWDKTRMKSTSPMQMGHGQQPKSKAFPLLLLFIPAFSLPFRPAQGGKKPLLFFGLFLGE